MMRHGSLSGLTISRRAGDGQGEARREERSGEGVGRQGALQHSQHCQRQAMRLNYEFLAFAGIH